MGATGIVRLDYYNASRIPVPPWGILQFDNTTIQTPTGDYVMNAIQPTGGSGPYFIDNGQGTGTSGPTQFGKCFRAVDGAVWASYSGAVAPNPWQVVGPTNNSFSISTNGIGYYYAGGFDAVNKRILVVATLGGSSTPRVHFVVNHTLAVYYGTVAAVNATILDITCGASPPGLNYDGTIDIYDPAGCYFNESQTYGYADVYAGRHGYADYMQPYNSYGYSDYGYTADCRWVVSALCCPPESS